MDAWDAMSPSKVLPAGVSADVDRRQRFEQEARAGQKFLVDRVTEDPAPITILLNWAGLKR